VAAAGSSDDPVYYRPAEVAEILRCSVWWVKEQARNRRIPFSWIGGGYLFTAEHIVEIVALFERRPDGQLAATNRARMSRQSNRIPSEEAVVQLLARAPQRARRASKKVD
jgi:hypothetical protein